MSEVNKRLLLSPDAIGTSLIILVFDLFGPEAFDWEPDVLSDELARYAGAALPQNSKDAVQAMLVLLESDRFFTDPSVFNFVCNALSGEGQVLFTMFDPAAPEELAWAVSESMLHKPLEADESLETRFSESVRVFISSILSERGFLSAPSPLDFVDLGASEAELSVTREDPLMFEAMWRLQDNNRLAIGRFVRDRMNLLRDQLSQLSLVNGSLDPVVERMSTVLR